MIEVLTNEPDSSKVRVRIFSQLQKKPGIADENIVAEFIDLNKKKESTASWEHIHD